MANEEKVLKSEVVDEEIKVKKPSFMDKLHNFRLLNILYAAGGVAATLFSILFLVFYQVDRMYMGNISADVKAIGEENVAYMDNQLLGFFIFTIAVITIIVGVLQVYNAWPYILKKDKLTVKKFYGYMSLALGVLCVVMMAFAIVNMIRLGVHRDVVNEQPVFTPYRGSLYFWIPMTLFFLLGAIYNALVFVPILSVKVYMPEFVKKDNK